MERGVKRGVKRRAMQREAAVRARPRPALSGPPDAGAVRRPSGQTSAAKARSRMVSTEPMPAIRRYFGAMASPVAAHFE